MFQLLSKSTNNKNFVGTFKIYVNRAGYIKLIRKIISNIFIYLSGHYRRSDSNILAQKRTGISKEVLYKPVTHYSLIYDH